MAMSNRERVGRGFDNLADGLVVFVDRQMSNTTDGLGEDWIQKIKTRDDPNLSAATSYDKNNLTLQLKMITDETQIFEKLLNPVQKSLATELREVRSEWEHNKKFNNDDTSIHINPWLVINKLHGFIRGVLYLFFGQHQSFLHACLEPR